MSHIRVVDSPNSGAKSDPKVGPQKKQLKVDKGHNREISWPQRTQQNGGAHVLTDTFHKKVKHKSTKTLNRINISSTSSRKDPIASRRFSPPNPSSRGYGRCCSAHPPLPWPRWAARRRKRGRCRLRSAAVCRLGSRGPRAPKPAGRTPTERKGRKILRKFWHLKSGSFGTCGHSNSSLNLRNIVVLKCLEVIELLERHGACAILVKDGLDKLDIFEL